MFYGYSTATTDKKLTKLIKNIFLAIGIEAIKMNTITNPKERCENLMNNLFQPLLNQLLKLFSVQ